MPRAALGRPVGAAGANDTVPFRRSRTVRTLAKTPPLMIAMARPCQPIPKLEPKRQSTMQLTRAEWNPNKPSPSGDALKTSFKCQLYGTDPIASPSGFRDGHEAAWAI
jgi:hypothetical protein